MFSSALFSEMPGDLIFEDRFCQVEMAVAFRKLTCHKCDFSAFYKFRTQQVRRRPEILTSEEEVLGPDQIEIWKTIPRFAEVPETLKCKRCKEVLGVDVSCIF